ncbi:MAG: AEC family transporter [Clostridia bacterium]|nr:AEC family transporter [Clostridia bacterium]
MDAFLIMLKNVIVFVLLAVPGYLLVKGGVMTTKESGVISKVLTYVGLPFMILTSTLKVEFTKEFAAEMGLLFLFGLVFTFLMVFVTAFLSKGVRDEKKKGMMRFAMSFANNGFLGIPLATAVFLNTRPAVVTFLVVLNIMNNLMLFSLGISIVSGDKSAIRLKKLLLNPVLLAFVAGVILNVSGLAAKVPAVGEYSTYFSSIVTALSMVVLGIKLADVPFSKLFLNGNMYYVSFVRLIAFPVLSVALMFLLRTFLPISDDMILGVFIAFVMPTAGLASTFADQYGGDTEGAVVYTLGSTVLSVGVIPLLYWLVEWILK